MRILRQRGWLVAATALVAWNCGGGSDGPPAPPKVATVSVTAPGTQLEVGSTMQLGAAARDGRGNPLTGRSVTWATSSASVATVDLAGVVTGVSAGSVTITATVEGVSGSVQLTVVPVPVALVLISPRTPSVREGGSTQLTAITQDAIGRPLTGRTITWTSRSPAVATIDNAGVVTGVAAGSAWIVATSETRQDSVSLRVRSLVAPTVSGTAPAEWTPGAQVTVTGTNFSPTVSENQVFVNGALATVTAATTTSLSVTVPGATQLPCSPTGPVPVIVAVSGDSATGTANLRMATPRTLAVGGHLLFTSPADLACNEFPVTGGKYLVTAFNWSTSAASRASFQLLGAATAASAAQASVAMLPPAAPRTLGPLGNPQVLTSDARFALGHSTVLQENARLMVRNSALRRALLGRRARARQGLMSVSPSAREVFASIAPATARAAPLPPPTVGDMQWKRMMRTFGTYSSFDSIRTRVVYVGPHLIIMEDSTNELFSKMDAEYQAVGAEFDRDMWGFLSNFGDPLAIDSLTDNNGRVIALFSKRVNEYTLSNGGSLLGFVTLCDFFAQADPDPNNVCLPSNEGEYFYAITPNPNGVRGKHDLATWKRYARGTMIHELKHVVMFVQRILLDASFTEETWLEEATAQVATELWARKLYGSSPQRGNITWLAGPRCDYATQSATCPDPVEAILHPFQFLYTHYNANETKSIINNLDLVIYGSSWSFARWITDTYDGGNEALFLQRLVQQRDDRGITNVVNRTGRAWSELLGLFSMASTADDYPGGTITDPRLRLASWNTRDVFAGMSANLVFRNPDGTTTPAFPRAWPLNVRTPTFGTFPDFVRTVSGLPGGGWAAWEISGTQVAPQVLALRALNGAPAPLGLGMVVLRVQ